MKQARDLDLKDKIDHIHCEFPYYGYRRIQKALAREGQIVNHKRIRRVMREYGLFTTIPRAFKNTTQSQHSHKRYGNLLKTIEVKAPNQAWGTDITYIRILSGFVFLAVVMDVFSRKIIGWALGRSLSRELTLAALRRAIERRAPPAGCVHHSDQGVQYCCEDYIELLNQNHFQISMSAAGNPYDNAYVESFMKTLKMEEVYLANYRSYEEVLERIVNRRLTPLVWWLWI